LQISYWIYMQSTYSQNGLQDASSTAAEYNSTLFIINRAINKLATATLVQVQSPGPYDSSGNPINTGSVVPIGFVDVLPLVNQLDGQGNATTHQVIHGLPYFRFAGGSNAVICDPVANDIGLAVFCHSDISNVKTNKEQANPGSRRHFDYADWIYFGLCLSGTPNQFIAFTSTGITIQDMNGNKIVMSSSGIKFTGKIEAVNDVTLDGKLNVAGDTTVNNINIQGTETGGGPT